MPQTKPKASEIAAEAKRTYIPYIEQKLPQFPPGSFFHAETLSLSKNPGEGQEKRLRVAVIDGDPVDVALGWADSNSRTSVQNDQQSLAHEETRIPVVNMANEKRAGGDWESGLMAPEECLCRRSNLVHALTTPWTASAQLCHYPIPTKGGLYSPHVVVFRSGPDRGYSLWKDFKSLPVISVAPVRRPKLEESGLEYSFDEEKELMKEKMRTVLRIAAAWRHRDICMGPFGVGPGFRNPVNQIAAMWRAILFTEEEFQGVFDNAVFAVESTVGGNAKGGMTDYDVFNQEFHPSNVVQTAYR
ncbi:hypothetical protein MMC08_004810 [Hypocenomyce scalaris]|nr:hypothetical protein [Hypocenomyce scalaris]